MELRLIRQYLIGGQLREFFRLSSVHHHIFRCWNTKGQVENVWENAKDVNGKVYDPNTGEELTWDTFKSRISQWDMGHTAEDKYSVWHEKYMKGELTTEDFLNWCRDPKNYLPESPSANRSHLYE